LVFLFSLAADFFKAPKGNGRTGFCWRFESLAMAFFEDEVDPRAWMAMAEAGRGEREMVARLQNTARTAKRGLRATMVDD
jgi:hypothetical protein